MKKKLSVQTTAKNLYGGDESAVWAAIADGSLAAEVLAESQNKQQHEDFVTAVTPEMAHRFMSGQRNIDCNFVRPYAPMHTGMAGGGVASIVVGGAADAPFIVRRTGVLATFDAGEQATSAELSDLETNHPLVAELLRVYRNQWKSASRAAPPKSEVIVADLVSRGFSKNEAECIDTVLRPAWAKKGGRKPSPQKT